MISLLKRLCCCTSTPVDIKPPKIQEVPPKVQFNNFVVPPPIPQNWPPSQVEQISPQVDRRPFVFPPEIPLTEKELPSIEEKLEGWEFSPDLVKEFDRCETPETCTGSQQELALAYTAYQTAWLCTKAIRRPLPLPRGKN